MDLDSIDSALVGPPATAPPASPPRRQANEQEIKALAKVFHARLGTKPIDARQVGAFVTWLDLYNHMDMDGSGHVDFREFEWMVRKELGVRASSLPDATLGALWNALDLNGKGTLTFGDFGHFMRYCSRGEEEELGHRLPAAIVKLGERYRGQHPPPTEPEPRCRTYVNEAGVNILSPYDSEALEVRARHDPRAAPRRAPAPRPRQLSLRTSLRGTRHAMHRWPSRATPTGDLLRGDDARAPRSCAGRRRSSRALPPLPKVGRAPAGHQLTARLSTPPPRSGRLALRQLN